MTTGMSRSEERKEVGEWRPSRSGEGTRRHKYVFYTLNWKEGTMISEKEGTIISEMINNST
jgi:hypothetical protein